MAQAAQRSLRLRGDRRRLGMDRRDRAGGARRTAGGRRGRRAHGLERQAPPLRRRSSRTALYDWDSVTTELEPTLVGTAAGSFTYTEELDDEIDVWPTAYESLAFIEEYEVARGVSFPEEERQTAIAACVYLRAYAARCQHAYAGNAHSSGLAAFAVALLG